MNHDTHALRSTLLLGVDHPQFGHLAVVEQPATEQVVGEPAAVESPAVKQAVTEQPAGRSVAVLCAGGDALHAARGAKFDMAVPNEDAVLVCDSGASTLLAVADSHWGHLASHLLLERLAKQIEMRGVPAHALDLLRILPHLADPPGTVPTEGDRSETTLLIAIVGRDRRHGFGIGVGDSACFLVEPRRAVTRLDRPTNRYVTPRVSASLDPRGCREFEFALPADGLLMLCSDGVHECCYGQPARSISLSHLAALAERCAQTPTRYATAVAELALAGVEGQPGGQDNVAIAVTDLRPTAG